MNDLKSSKVIHGWGLRDYSKNERDGERVHLLWSKGRPLFFNTREEARAYNREHYGYIRNRPDLQREPHGWTVPKVVKVIQTITFELEVPE